MAITINPSGTELQIAKSAEFTEIINTDDGTYRTSQAFAQDELPFGINLYARVRHNAPETGYSKWSTPVSFHVEVPAQIIGICADTAQSPAAVYWIDMDGNKVDSPDLANHPVFKAITMATLDSDRAPVTMTKFPRFYIKTAVSGPAASFAEGKPCWWISDMPFEGFRVHPAFKRLNTRGSDGKYQTAEYCYIGTFCGHTESVGGKTCLGSKQGSTIATGSSSTVRSSLLSYCTNRNDAGSGNSGWRMFDIYDVSLLRFLGSIWKGTFNFQSAYGTNTSASPKAGATQCRIVFQGSQSSPTVWIDDLWSCYWQHVNLITSSSGRVALTSPMDSSSNISLGGSASDYTMATSSGFIKSFCSTSFVLGDDSHDLLELFLPKTVVGSESSSLAPDYHNYNTETNYMKIGGYWGSSAQGGLFSDTQMNDSYQESYQSWEIVDYETISAGWNSSRRCGYIFYSRYFNNGAETWEYCAAGTSSGNLVSDWDVKEHRCNCPQKYGPYDVADRVYLNNYTAVCQYTDWITPGSYNQHINYPASANWVRSNTCPKGWGKYYYAPESKTRPYVQCAQGYVPTGYKEPIYGYVTRYRDVYYDYLTTRVAKI